MPTPPRTYSPAAAEKLRRALLALAASAATLTAHAQDAEGNFDGHTSVSNLQDGGPGRERAGDTWIFSPLLY